MKYRWSWSVKSWPVPTDEVGRLERGWTVWKWQAVREAANAAGRAPRVTVYGNDAMICPRPRITIQRIEHRKVEA